MSAYKSGDVVRVKLHKDSDSGTNGAHRYAVIISADIVNDNLQTVIVCPLIEAQRVTESRIGATFVPGDVIGMENDSLVFTLQIKTISKDRIVKRVSSLPATYLSEIKESLQAVLDID